MFNVFPIGGSGSGSVQAPCTGATIGYSCLSSPLAIATTPNTFVDYANLIPTAGSRTFDAVTIPARLPALGNASAVTGTFQGVRMRQATDTLHDTSNGWVMGLLQRLQGGRSGNSGTMFSAGSNSDASGLSGGNTLNSGGIGFSEENGALRLTIVNSSGSTSLNHLFSGNIWGLEDHIRATSDGTTITLEGWRTGVGWTSYGTVADPGVTIRVNMMQSNNAQEADQNHDHHGGYFSIDSGYQPTSTS